MIGAPRSEGALKRVRTQSLEPVRTRPGENVHSITKCVGAESRQAATSGRASSYESQLTTVNA